MSSFFSKPDPKQQMRANDRAMRGTQRGLTKDLRELDRQEKQLEMEIKKLAKQGNREACTVLAKQLVNLRKQKTKNVGMGAKVSGINAQSKTMYSNVKMADAMKTTAKTMGEFNKQMDPAKLAKEMQEFEKANMQMDMGEEMMNEAMDSIMDESGDEEEQDAIVNKVLDEIGIEIKGQLAKAPTASGKIGEGPSTSKGMTDAELENMLAKIKAD